MSKNNQRDNQVKNQAKPKSGQYQDSSKGHVQMPDKITPQANRDEDRRSRATEDTNRSDRPSGSKPGASFNR